MQVTGNIDDDRPRVLIVGGSGNSGVPINVGTIGHIDHGKLTVRELLRNVVIVDEANVSGLEVLQPYQQEAYPELDVYGPNGGRLRSRHLKKQKKAKLRELQRRAFLGE